MARFIMLVGIPGCGKSTYTKDKDAVIVSSDATRKEFGYDQGQETGAVFEIMQKRSREALSKGEDVIFDATNLTRKRRMGILNGLNNVPCTKKCVLFTEPYEECLRRNATRTGFDLVPDDIMYTMLTNFQTPMLCEGFDDIEIVQTVKGKPIDAYIEESKGFDQENHHHELPLYDHIRMAADYIYKSTNQEFASSRMLYDAALYHDIGKLYTKDFKDSHGNVTEEAHYYGHENVGAYLYLTADKSENGRRYTKDQELYIASLINWHMRPYIEMSPRKKEYERRLVGEDFWTKIQFLHQADEYAH